MTIQKTITIKYETLYIYYPELHMDSASTPSREELIINSKCISSLSKSQQDYSDKYHMVAIVCEGVRFVYPLSYKEYKVLKKLLTSEILKEGVE